MWWLLACTPSPSPAPPQARQEAPPPPPGPVISGADLQDPTGFPRFHGQPSPQGPAPGAAGAWTDIQRLSADEGGLRPQIAAGPDGTLHVVYYAQTSAGDLLRHRVRPVRGACAASSPCAWEGFEAPEPFGAPSGRNWGPDLVVRADGSAVVSWDHSEPGQQTGRVMLDTWRDGRWAEPEVVRDPAGAEVGSAHVADARGDDLALVWIERALDPSARFQAMGRWLLRGSWTEAAPLPVPATDAGREAWHTNVERRPDGSVLAGWDLGPGGGENQVLLSVGRDGAWEAPIDASEGQAWGERPHFAFAPDGAIHAIWFHRVMDHPLDIWLRQPDGALRDLSRGLGGFQFDPEIAIDPAGDLLAVWGWDAGEQADLVYSLKRPRDDWSRPARVCEMSGKKPGLPSLAVSPDGVFHVVWAWWVRGQSEVWYATLRP